ncbi:hypothetical protein [Caulobacter phage Cr30]|uniref:hypothetical protein n=1 Tax=Caulobacter phage Cr30 TaxID=1357714 RepID=UPI0004A9B777|nr:hypothetical protein OZ74_gp074 [Caulobacter phage Cr30]AGS80959.1 hypothetical protein [Caulobacter phage Cr30]
MSEYVILWKGKETDFTGPYKSLRRAQDTLEYVLELTKNKDSDWYGTKKKDFKIYESI